MQDKLNNLQQNIDNIDDISIKYVNKNNEDEDKTTNDLSDN